MIVIPFSSVISFHSSTGSSKKQTLPTLSQIELFLRYLSDEEKKEIFKEIKNRINEIYLKPELIGGGPNSIPKLINHYDLLNEMYGDYGDYRTIGIKEKFTELAKNINGGMGLIKESNESTDGENHAHND